MPEIEFVDQTLRDGQQSWWGFRMRACEVTAVADLIDRAGFRVVDLTGGALFETSMRYLREDPWEVLDWLRGCLPHVNLRAARRTTSTGKFGLTPNCILDLFNQALVKHGINSFWIYDCLYNMEKMEWAARSVTKAGAEAVPAVMFGVGPAYTDEFFADKVRQMASWGVAKAIYLEDAPGILTPERAATLVPAIVEAAAGLPVEMHCHNTTGLAPLNYIEAIKHGVRIIHTASRPLANGPSLPSTEMMVHNLAQLGHSPQIDTSTLEPIAQHFERVARQEGRPFGVPNEYDVGAYVHQLPGGMTGSLKAQLAQYQMEDRLPEVLEEIARVREDLGHPVSATPFSQLIGIQSVLNITTGQRYGVVPDEIIMYVLGHYGHPPVPVDEDVKDRVLSTPRAQDFLDWQPPQPSLEEMRRAYGGPHLSDEELLLRYLASAEDIEATRAAGPLRREYVFEDDPSVAALVRAVLDLRRPGHVHLTLPDVALTLRRASGTSHSHAHC